jgi:hypothetical protein
MDFIHILLHSAIDYAGLFPPASLDMASAVRNYASYRNSTHAWALGRFIVPSARIPEFDAAAGDLTPPFPLSILTSPGAVPPDAAEVVEVKAASAGDVAATKKVLPDDVTAYFEIDITRDPSEMIAAIADAGARAKVRTGGVTPDLFPAAADVARFIARCARARVAFKATAGLHHPIRAMHNLTYEPNSASGIMHGFLNVFLASALLYCGGSEDDAVRTLEEQSPTAFQFDEHGAAWGGRRLTTQQIADARQNLIAGFGSCSFEEPIADLQSMGLL